MRRHGVFEEGAQIHHHRDDDQREHRHPDNSDTHEWPHECQTHPCQPDIEPETQLGIRDESIDDLNDRLPPPPEQGGPEQWYQDQRHNGMQHHARMQHA